MLWLRLYEFEGALKELSSSERRNANTFLILKMCYNVFFSLAISIILGIKLSKFFINC